MIRPFCSESVFNILLPGDVVVPKCPRSELLLEFTTLRPVRTGVVHGKIRDGCLNLYTPESDWIVSDVAIPGTC